jgi:hypothetical protein
MRLIDSVSDQENIATPTRVHNSKAINYGRLEKQGEEEVLPLLE